MVAHLTVDQVDWVQIPTLVFTFRKSNKNIDGPLVYVVKPRIDKP